MGGISVPHWGRRRAPGPYVPVGAPRSPCKCAPCTTPLRPSVRLQSLARVVRPLSLHPRGIRGRPVDLPLAAGARRTLVRLPR
eukprot:4817325-Pyramimonas_sp.AAC.1